MTKVLDILKLKIGRAHQHLRGDCSPTDRRYEELADDTNSISQHVRQQLWNRYFYFTR